jgi:hypothetical protein
MANHAAPAPIIGRLLLIYSLPPQPDDPERYAKAATVIRWHELAFAETNNPLYAWSAYHYARAAGLEVPGWVFAYLDSSAEKLWVTARRKTDPSKKSDSTALFAVAFGMKRRGRGSVFSEFRGETYAAQAWLAALVHSWSRAHGKPYLEWENVAKECGVSVTKVRRAWGRYKHHVRV